MNILLKRLAHSLQQGESFCLQVLYHQLSWGNPACPHDSQILHIYENIQKFDFSTHVH